MTKFKPEQGHHVRKEEGRKIWEEEEYGRERKDSYRAYRSFLGTHKRQLTYDIPKQ